MLNPQTFSCRLHISLSFRILRKEEKEGGMSGRLTFYHLTDESATEVLRRIEAFNRGRTGGRGCYAVSLATEYRPYYALWRVFTDTERPLFVRTLAVTFDAAAERAMQLLGNCNIRLEVENNVAFEACYGQTDDIIPFGRYKGKRLAEIYYLAPSYVLWLANRFVPDSQRYDRLVELAKRFACVHFELTVQKRRISSVSRFVGEKGDKLDNLEVTVLNVRLQVDTYKPDFYVDQNVLAADRDGNRFTFLIKAAGQSLTPKSLYSGSRKVERQQTLRLASAKVMGHYESHGVKYTRLGYVRVRK